MLARQPDLFLLFTLEKKECNLTEDYCKFIQYEAVLCCTCTRAMHSFLGRSVYKHLCTVSLSQTLCVVSIFSVGAPWRTLTVSTLVCSGFLEDRIVR